MWVGHTHDRSRQRRLAVAQRAGDDEPRETPSQAEGDRATVERSLGEGQGDMVYTPSQAEGDRETVERNLEKKQAG